MRDPRPLLYNLLLLLFLGLIAWGLFRSPQWDWPHLVVCITTAGFVALLGNMDRLESFKAGAGGIEAKTREVVKQAESAIGELQLMAERTAAVLFELIDGGGRWGGAHSASEKDARKRELRDLLKRLGLPDARIAMAAASERKWALIDYVMGICDQLKIPPEKNAEWSEAWKPWNDTLERPDPTTLRKLLSIVEPLAPWRSELILDYEHYWRTGQHRRPSVWAARDQWYEWTQAGQWPDRIE